MARGAKFESDNPSEEGGGRVPVTQHCAAKTGSTLRRSDYGGNKDAHLHPKVNGEFDHSQHVPAGEGKLNATGVDHNPMLRARRYIQWYRNSRKRGRGGIPPEMIV